MIVTLGTIMVWCLIVAGGVFGVLCAFIGLMFLIYYPKR